VPVEAAGLGADRNDQLAAAGRGLAGRRRVRSRRRSTSGKGEEDAKANCERGFTPAEH